MQDVTTRRKTRSASASRTSRGTVGSKRIRHRLPPARRAEQLLDVAERLFAAQGFRATSIEQIAQESGVTRPVVYDRFGGKDGIYLACLRRARHQLEESMFGEVARTGDSLKRLRAGADAYFGFVESSPQRWRVLFGGGASVSGDVADEAMRLRFETEKQIADWLGTVAPKADHQSLAALAHAIGGASHQLAQWWLRNPGIAKRRIVDYFVKFSWPAIRELARS
ncbi:MAG: TetR/AcrR family transcriptional regulator [Actinobacteria bacterium]|nr:MAG: TetR/AcrR family transcriptional regulator [Actinomycetota bacterium]